MMMNEYQNTNQRLEIQRNLCSLVGQCYKSSPRLMFLFNESLFSVHMFQITVYIVLVLFISIFRTKCCIQPRYSINSNAQEPVIEKFYWCLGSFWLIFFSYQSLATLVMHIWGLAPVVRSNCTLLDWRRWWSTQLRTHRRYRNCCF